MKYLKSKILFNSGFLLVWMLNFLLINFVWAQAVEQNLEIVSLTSTQVDFASLARSLPVGRQMVLEELPISGMRGNQRLLLERFPIFALDAMIVNSKGERLSAPDNAYYRGQVDGLPDSIVLMTVPEQGQPRGLIFTSNRIMILEGRASGAVAGFDTREVDIQTELAPLSQEFRCDVEKAHSPENPILNKILRDPGLNRELSDRSGKASPAGYTINVAVETDYEYYALFSNQTAALNYLGDLIAYASVMYEREVGTRLQISYTKLWVDGPSSDPWTATSTSALLGQLMSYWNTNNSSVNRATVHMLSGRPYNSGIAYVGVLCNKQYGYGVTTSIRRFGSFDINNPSIVWDIVAVSHELGHNFGSEHTHCYAGVGGNNNDVDHCYGQEGYGCYSGFETLPGINSLTGGVAGDGGGTIMSYCHLLGGMSSLSLTFGQNHPYGIAAYRVPNLMSAFVAGLPASCTVSTLYTLTVSKTGSGTVGGGGSYAAGASVTLTATPAAGSVFAGWSPSPCAASFAMPSQNLTCTATFNPAPTYTLSVAKSGAGSGTVGGGGSYAAGAPVVLTATPAAGSVLAGWSPSPCAASFAMPGQNLTCTATFNPEPTYTLSVAKNGTGSGAVGGGGSYAAGAPVVLTATPAAGSVLAGWSPSPCAASFAMPGQNLTCTATFNPEPTYTLSVVKSGAGSGTVASNPAGIDCGADCGESYPANTVVTLSATPAGGSVFGGWSGACSGTGGCTVTMNAAKGVVATFNPVGQTPAQHTVGLYNPAASAFYLRTSHAGGAADRVYGFGPPNAGWVPLAGDWDGDGITTVGLYEPANGAFFLKNSNGPGPADVIFSYGPPNAGWVPLAGDWDGDGTTTVGLYNPATSTFYLKNSHTGGAADRVYGFGPPNAGWVPLAGDWDGDGTTTIGLYSPAASVFYLRDGHAGGPADRVYGFGPPNAGWVPLAGDWDGDGTTTIGLYSPATSTFYLRDGHAGGAADQVYGFGPPNAGWVPLVGDWNGPDL